MRNMRVAKKLIIGFLISIIMTVIVGGVGFIGMMQINQGFSDMYDNQTVPLPWMAHILEDVQTLRVYVREFNIAAFYDDTARIEEVNADVGTTKREITAYLDLYGETIISPEAQTLFADTRALLVGEYAPHLDRVYEYALAGDTDAIREDIAAIAGVYNTIVNNFATLLEMKIEVAAEADQAGNDLFAMLVVIIVIVLIIAVAVALVLAFYISGLISKPIAVLTGFMKKAGSTGDLSMSQEDNAVVGKMQGVKDEIGELISGAASFVGRVTEISSELQTVAGGDLTVQIHLLSESDVMGLSMKQMVENLNNMFAEINSSANQVSAGSKQIADGAQSLAQGSTEQAASVQQLSSSIAEIAQKTRTNAEMAQKTAALAHTIMGSAEKGSSQMDEMIQAVKDINEASQSIGKIIKTIDDIAFQTNILALNAAVEAARAGQHGKGFAVVAEEVRNLAAKSAEAAKDTGVMIQNSMEKAEFGTRIAGDTATSLTDIISGINESATLIDDINKSSEEQSQGIAQVNIGIDQVAQVVQQNSATAEQSAAASQELSGQSDMLQSLIAQFKLKNAGRNFSLNAPSHPRPQAPASDASFDDGNFGKY